MEGMEKDLRAPMDSGTGQGKSEERPEKYLSNVYIFEMM